MANTTVEAGVLRPQWSGTGTTLAPSQTPPWGQSWQAYLPQWSQQEVHPHSTNIMNHLSPDHSHATRYARATYASAGSGDPLLSDPSKEYDFEPQDMHSKLRDDERMDPSAQNGLAFEMRVQQNNRSGVANVINTSDPANGNKCSARGQGRSHGPVGGPCLSAKRSTVGVRKRVPGWAGKNGRGTSSGHLAA
jgi:hypothetical protein